MRKISKAFLRIILLTISIFVFGLALPTFSFAQGMPVLSEVEGMGNKTGSDGHTAREEAEGKAVWEKLQTKELICKDLSDDNFGTLGEYFMGQMVGEQHEAMNDMMTRMMGKEGEEQMHMAMGKRMSSCDPNAPMPENMMNMMSMMGGMMNSRTWSMGNMMGWSNFGLSSGWAWLGWIILGIVGIVALIKWIAKNK